MFVLARSEALNRTNSGCNAGVLVMLVCWCVHVQLLQYRCANVCSALSAALPMRLPFKGMQVKLSYVTVPGNITCALQSTMVQLPNGTQYNQTRFALHGVRKVWVVCPHQARELRVSLSDLP